MLFRLGLARLAPGEVILRFQVRHQARLRLTAASSVTIGSWGFIRLAASTVSAMAGPGGRPACRPRAELHSRLLP